MRIEVYRSVIISQENGFFVVKCCRCKGTGQDAQDSRDPCGTCSGSGHVALPIREGMQSQSVGVVACGRCKGSGRDAQDYRDACSTCHGVGSIFIGDLKSY